MHERDITMKEVQNSKKRGAFQAKKEQHFHGAKYSQRVHKNIKDYDRQREKNINKFLNEEE